MRWITVGILAGLAGGLLPACADINVDVDTDRWLSVAAAGPAGPLANPQRNGGVEDVRKNLPRLLEDDAGKARQIAKLNRRLVKHFRAERYDRCKPLLDRILQLDPDNRVAWYNLACLYSLQGETDKAMGALTTSVEKGFTDFRHMARDPDLSPLRREDRYRRLLSRKDEILRSHAMEVRDRLRERFGEEFLYEIDHEHKLVFATDVDARTLAELKAHLTRYAQAQWRALLTHRFEQYVTVVIPKNWRRRGLGGYYRHDRRLLVSATIGMTLNHEFTHALHFADQEGLGQRHPVWIAEGLATLFESCRLRDGRAVPQPNHRLTVLKHLIRRDRTMPLGKLVQADHETFLGRASASYAQSRYLLMYLHARGALKAWYDAYTAGYEDDPTGRAALEKVLGKDLPEIEEDWRQWVLDQPSPPRRLAAHHAYLGVRVRGVADGVRISHVVVGSGADEADLRPGDVIVKVDGRRIVEPSTLICLVDECEVGRTLDVEIRRGEQYRTVEVTLGAMPEELPIPTSRPSRKKAG